MKQVAVGIILKDGLVLACQRKQNAVYPLKWEFPGGKIETGESATEALVREMKEELDIDVVVDQLFHRQTWDYAENPSGKNNGGTFDVTYFLVHSFSGEPVNHAFEQILWVTPSALPAMDILEGNRDAVKLLMDYVNNQDSRPDAAPGMGRQKA